MEREDLKALDDYIMGTHIHYSDDVLHKCPKCGYTTKVLMEYELGGWFYPNDDNAFCPNCNIELEIEED